MKNQIFKIIGITSLLILSLTFTASAAENDARCNTPFDWRPAGVSHEGGSINCPEGLGFPTFNAYNDANVFETGGPISEQEFAWVRVPENEFRDVRQNYKKNIYLPEGEIARTWNYIHNAGKPGRTDTIARNVKIKMNGFERQDDGSYLHFADSTRGSRDIHEISVTISASNTTPRSITDTFTVETDRGKAIRILPEADRGRRARCTNITNTPGAGCNPVVDNFAPHNIVSGSGISLESTHRGGERNVVHASEGYRIYISTFLEVVNPPEEAICEVLEFTQMNTPANEGDRVTFRLDEVTDGFRNDIRFNESDGDISTGSFNIADTVSIRNWENGDEFVAKVTGQPRCEYRAPLEAPIVECSDLVLTPNFRDENLEFVGQEVSFRVDVAPRSFFDQIQHDLDRRRTGVTTRNNGRTIDVVGWSEGSTVTSRVPGSADCIDTYTFPDLPEEEVPICRSLEFDTNAITRDGSTAIIPTEIVVDEDYGDYEVTTETNDTSGSTFNESNNTVVVTGIDENTTVTAFIEEEDGSIRCRDTHSFFTTIEDDCELLTLEEVNRTDDTITLEASVTPSEFNIIATVEGEGTITVEEDREGFLRFQITNFDEDTVVTVDAEDTEVTACSKQFDNFPAQENLCRDLDVTPNSYDHTVDPVETFRATTSPRNLDAPFIWEVYETNSDGEEERVSRTENDGTFTLPGLDGRQRIRVFIEDEFVEEGYSCEAEIEGEVPFNLCPDLQIRRPGKPSYESAAFCPSNGQPIILQATGFDDFEDNIVWRAEGECNELTGPIFTDGEQEARCELVSDINNPVIIRGCNPSNFITVESVSEPEQCNAVIPPRDLPGDKPGEIFKEVVHSSFVSRDVNRVKYRVTYKPNFSFFSNIFDEVTLFDNIGEILPGQNPEFSSLGILPGTLSPIPGTMIVTNVPAGGEVTGNIFSPDGVTITNLDNLAVGDVVSIEYEAELNSALRITDACERLANSCGETFINTAFDNFGQESSASLTALCPFILARGFGDVFLEQDFSTGIDIAKCTSRPSAEGPVFTPAPPETQEIVSTGSELVGPSHRVCKEGGVEGYGDEVLGSISSSVCEVGLTLADRWQTETITNGIEVNILRIARNLIPLASSTISNLSEATLANINPNPGSQVIIRDNADLTIGTAGQNLTVDGQAKTIIVRNGNLRINSNIEYGPATDPTKPPVIAFLVINGNIEIDPSVTDLAGIYAAVAKDEGTGFIERAGGTSNNLITIRGSVFGDIEPLFNQTTAVGDLVRDRGAVTVIYDGRIVLNTPPGLEDIVEFNQYQTANGSQIFN
jgi:hypothetical protein